MTYLLNLVENPVNCQLHNTQAYTETTQKPDQTVYTFAAYLSILKAQLSLYNEDQLVMHFFIKLHFELKKTLFNY